ncbi:hypothetical protein ES319_A11G164600v1 [Gossypium barbadense]|uniref:Protein kinase domain-containing protein n=1 Tax=Gossypium barbadense TaxID=3634 RepID=A0A5J5TRN6_GOSBA|nr:hypothetical protein ES319_A11G164600v1 [Gossypium barbadense]
MLLKLFPIPLLFILTFSISVESRCTRSCTALASYYVPPESNLTFVSELFNSTLAPSSTLNFDSILSYNKQVANKDSVESGTRLNVPFPCDCINGSLPAHEFSYRVRSNDTYYKIATEYYSNLTTVNWLLPFNTYPPTNIPDTGTVRVVVNCSCGDATISKDYGLFITYPLRPGENLSYVLTQVNLSSDLSGLVQRYNPGVNFSSGAGLVFIPGRDANGNFPPIQSSTGISGGVIAGISIAAIVVLLLLGIGVYIGFFRKKKVKGETLSSTDSQDLLAQVGNAFGSKAVESTPAVAASPGLTGISVDKSVEFSYEELAQATDNFSMAKKIGEGGFGAVYYANLRGEEAAIKKMDMQATKEFLAELKVLTHVHHLNLVRLIGYCVEGSLFLVYEYIENGNLSQHLRGSGCRFWINKTDRGWKFIPTHTSCWDIWIHATRIRSIWRCFS